MNRPFILGSLCGLLAASPVLATPFDDANRQFQAGDFAGAAASYEKILTDEGASAAVLYNLGNAYQTLRRYGPAILAYERARLLTTRDPDLRANLALARKAATAFEEPHPFPRLQAALDYLSRDEWSRIVVGGALFLGVLCVICGAMKLPRRPRKAAIISASLAGIAIIAGAVALYLRREEPERGIVLSDNATVRLSPFEKADGLGTAGTGRIVRLGAENGGFRYVQVPGTNLRGWLDSKDVVAIVPEETAHAGLIK